MKAFDFEVCCTCTCIILVEAKAPPIPFLVTVRSVAQETDFQQGARDIFVGCVRTMAVSQKKVGVLFH